MKKLLYILVFISSSTLFSQETSYRGLVLEYLELNGTTQQYQGAIDQLFGLLKQQFKSQNVGDAVWNELQSDAQPALQQIKAMLVSAYRGTYEKGDVENLLAFYKTGTGRQLVIDQTAMTETQKQEAASFFNTETGQKVISLQADISKSVSEVSEIWSRDLYRGMIDKLESKGFTLQQ